MGRVFVLGSLNVDLVARVERHPRAGETLMGTSLERLAGGKGANQAVAARTAGADVTLLGAVGDDEVGAAYVSRLAGLGVRTAAVRRVPGLPTGHALITVDAAGENTIVVVPGANAAVGREDLDELGSAGPGDVLLVSLEIPAPTAAAAVRTAAGRGARTVLNLAPYTSLPHDVLALADPVVVNEHEALLLADADVVPASLLVTFGAAGAAWDGVQVGAPEVAPDEVVDSTGAGDAFCGTLAAVLATGADRPTALAAALAAGAAAVRHAGAQRDPQLRQVGGGPAGTPEGRA